MTDNRPEPQKTGPLFADNCDYRAISRSENTRDQQPRTKEAAHMSDENEPDAYGLLDQGEVHYATPFRDEAERVLRFTEDKDSVIVPLYRSPPVTKPMPKEKRAEVCAGPLAWAAIRENGQPLWLSYDRSGAEGMVNGMAEVVPLYRSPTLTDAEREAVELAVAHGETVDAAWRYALRGLLERLK